MDWFYDELKQIGTDYNDLKQVEEYDDEMQELRDIKGEVEEIVSLTGIDASKTVLDIGTGTGEQAVRLAKFCEKVYAIDISNTMLEYASKKAQNRKVENIEFKKSGFLTCEFDNNSIDVVITQLALHHLPDFWKQIALKRIFKLLKNGGRLYIYDVVFDFAIDKYKEGINQFIELTRQGSEEMAEETKLHVKEEFQHLLGF